MQLVVFQATFFAVVIISKTLATPIVLKNTAVTGEVKTKFLRSAEDSRRNGYGEVALKDEKFGLLEKSRERQMVGLNSLDTTNGSKDVPIRQPVAINTTHEKTNFKSQAINNRREMQEVITKGKVDQMTIKNMVRKVQRCGNEIRPKYIPPNYGKRFRRALSKTNSITVTYKIASYSKKLTQSEIRAAIKLAFRKWAEVTPRVFRRSETNHANIIIIFAEGSHGCTIMPPFDGKGGVYGHMSKPTAQFSGEIHFDDAENWVVGVAGPMEVSLLRVAMHMAGHMLLLDHSTVPNAVMNAMYSNSKATSLDLHEDDIKMAHEKVGWCQTSFDSIESWMGNGRTYTFKGSHYWRFNDRSRRTETDYPKSTSVWRGIPEQIDEMLLWGHNWSTYFFRGNEYFKYDDHADHVISIWTISQGWPGVPDNIDAAFTHNDLKTYFFKDNLVYQFDNIADRVSTGYPKNISDVFPGVPDHIDTAFRWYYNGKSYFFKGLEFYEWNETLGRVDAPREISREWQNHCFT